MHVKSIRGATIPRKTAKIVREQLPCPITVDAGRRVWEELAVLHYFFEILNGGLGIVGSIGALLVFGFTIWMFVHAIRNGEYLWAVIIFMFSGLSALLYFFFVYRASGGGNPMTGFELPGAADRRQIKRLQADIHHLDKPHHHLQLADIYFSQGKLDLAETEYRAAYELSLIHI